MKRFNLSGLICIGSLFFFLSITGCDSSRIAQVDYDRWTVSEPILQAGPKGTFDDVAVKDPTIVFYNGQYHLFYTSKYTTETARQLKAEGVPVPPMRAGTVYVSAPTLEELKDARRHNLSKIVNEVVIAPQVFYFKPQNLWYIIAHRVIPGSRVLVPIYLTNPQIEDVYGWSRPKDIRSGRPDGGFWIDFWVICDEFNAHLFYSDQKGSVLRMQCPIEDFPLGLADAEEHIAATQTGEDDFAPWAMFEAAHIYRVQDSHNYFMIAEGAYWDENRNRYFDARYRFMIGLVADRLEGPWRRIEKNDDTYFSHADNLYYQDGRKSAYTQISHPELIRAGYNQRLEIKDFNIRMIFQSFDGSRIPENYIYDDLPWELAVMQNY